jgi:transposase
MDQAGWHRAHDLAMPDNLTLAFLPPYSPEFNAIERVWLHLKERYLSHRVRPDYSDILDAVCEAWNKLIDEPGRIKSLTNADWLASVKI